MKIIHIISDLGLGKKAVADMIGRSDFTMAVDVSLNNLDSHFKFSKYDYDMLPYCIALYGKLKIQTVNGVLRRIKGSIFCNTKIVGLKLQCKSNSIIEYYDDITEIR